MLIFNKEIDQSALNEGVSIPAAYQRILMDGLGVQLLHGQSRNIKIEIDGEFYDAVLKNQKFDRSKYQGHSDIVQIRYSPGSPIARKMREKFSYTERKIREQKELGEKNKRLRFEEKDKEFIAVYSTDQDDILSFDCICNTEFREEVDAISGLGEMTAEVILERTDPQADIWLRTRACKIRKIARSIGENLKKAYKYRCQICGQYIGQNYGSNLIHAHHIDYFVKSLNNNADNILIVCPNHHGIIHDCNPRFDRKKCTFKYPNGYEEGLKLNIHL